MKSVGREERGAVYTRREVVEFMLDLAGYTEDKPLGRMRLLEPSCGAGDFLLPAVQRLLKAARRDKVSARGLLQAVRGVELHRETFAETRDKLLALLHEHGFARRDATALAEAWLVNADFLLQPFSTGFDFVAGNPPYVRQEMIPAPLLAEYRRRFHTLYDRADLYVPFMEKSLRLLAPDGVLAFICSDRWMKNRYGGPLREMISGGYALRFSVDMVGTEAFQSEVTAYPAITVIQRGAHGPVRVAHRPEISAAALSGLSARLNGPSCHLNGAAWELPGLPPGSDPWLLESDSLPSLALVRRLEAGFPSLEEAGCTVGIGVATGADKVFIGPLEALDVEDERKLPLATTRDILTGTVQWRGLGVVNPFEDDGRLADFGSYPRFAAYMQRHREVLSKRHCAQRANGSWYRTIDRITPSLAKRPKLLIPDIKGEANIVLDESGLYPHHNLYYITSQEWPLGALQRVLLSGIARLFVRAYSTKMRGGCLRFQAQYLRRIRLPQWKDVPAAARRTFSQSGSVSARSLQSAIIATYRLKPDELNHLSE